MCVFILVSAVGDELGRLYSMAEEAYIFMPNKIVINWPLYIVTLKKLIPCVGAPIIIQIKTKNSTDYQLWEI